MCLNRKTGLAVFLGLATAMASATDVATLRNGFTIRHESRAPMGEMTRLFLTADGSSFVDIPTAEIVQIEADHTPPPPPETTVVPSQAAPAASHPRTTTPLPIATAPRPQVDVGQVVNEASGRYRLDPDLVNSVIRAESGFKVHAVSPKGAQGLMQLMPGTASKLGVPNAFDPEANVDGGTRYLRELLEKYNFDLIKALAAYNAGPHRVEQYNGVPPYRETRKYVASIVRDFNRKKLAQQKASNTQAAKSQTSKSRPKPGPQSTARTNTAASTKKATSPTGN